jgi:hypothetical protein
MNEEAIIHIYLVMRFIPHTPIHHKFEMISRPHPSKSTAPSKLRGGVLN